jgi:hypothetical protein
MRIIAILGVYNEERFIKQCLEHLFNQGLEVYLIDNNSTDNTVELARQYLHRGLLNIETLERDGLVRHKVMMRRKQELAATLDADWFMHVDADEFMTSPLPNTTLAQALALADSQGFNIINFFEFDFYPVQESPDHEHENFLETMRWYHPFTPRFPNLMRAWKRQPQTVDLVTSTGHLPQVPGRRMWPTSLFMRHYQCLSVEHAIRKYTAHGWDPVSVKAGMDWRPKLGPEMIKLPSQAEMRIYTTDDQLDPTDPRPTHYMYDLVMEHQRQVWQLSEANQRAKEQQSIEMLKQTIAQLESQLQAVNHVAAVAAHEIESLHNSRFYKISQSYWQIRDRLKSLLKGRP